MLRAHDCKQMLQKNDYQEDRRGLMLVRPACNAYLPLLQRFAS
jgi:hypothetical protein